MGGRKKKKKGQGVRVCKCKLGSETLVDTLNMVIAFFFAGTQRIMELHIQHKKVPLTHEESVKPETVEEIVKSYVPFKEWVHKMSDKKTSSVLNVKSVHIQSVDMFGPKIGFVKFKAEVLNQDGKNVPARTEFVQQSGQASLL